MDLDFLWGLLTPSAVTSGARYVATAALTFIATKLGMDASYIPAAAAGFAALVTAIYGMVKATPNGLKNRVVALADVEHIQLNNGTRLR